MLTLGFLTYNTLVYLIVAAFALLQATSSIGERFYKRKDSVDCLYAYGASYGSTYMLSCESHAQSCISILQNEVSTFLNTIKSGFTHKTEETETICESGIAAGAEKTTWTPSLEEGIRNSIFNRPPPALA